MLASQSRLNFWNERRSTIQVWDAETGQDLLSLNDTIRSIVFADQGMLILAIQVSLDRHTLQFRNVKTPSVEPINYPGMYFPSALALSPNGETIAFATGGGAVELYKSDGTFIGSVQAHLNAAASVNFSPDGTRLVTTFGGKEAVKIWNLETLQELLTLKGTGSYLDHVFWSKDGKSIVAGHPWQSWSAPSWEEIKKIENAQR